MMCRLSIDLLSISRAISIFVAPIRFSDYFTIYFEFTNFTNKFSPNIFHLTNSYVIYTLFPGYQHRGQRPGNHYRGRGHKGSGFPKESTGNGQNSKMHTVPLANPPPPLVSKISPHFDNSTPSEVRSRRI